MENLFIIYLYYKKPSNPKTKLHKELLKAFGNEDAMDIICDLEVFSKSYISILENENKYIYCLQYLNHNIYWQSILTTAEYKQYKDREKLKKILYAFYYKNWITGGTVSRIKQISLNILSGIKKEKPIEIENIEQMINENLDKCGTQPSFEKELKSERVYSQKWVKPLLLLIEYFSKDDSNQSSIPLDNKTSIEHILPRNTDDDSWNHFTPEARDKWTHSLANVTLLSMRKNIQASNSSFEEKKDAYTKKR